MCCDILINGIPLAQYGGKALLDYTIGETELTNETFHGINRSNWVNLKTMYGLRQVTITILFEGTDLHQAKLARSKFNAAIFGSSELYIPDDGFYYSVYCESIGEETLVGIGENSAQVKAQYTFSGIRHGEKKTVTVAANGNFICHSTLPFTDCKLTATVSTNRSNYHLGGAVFPTVTAGDVLVFDGINCLITRNGANAAGTATWLNFPALTAGSNTIDCVDTVTVEYYPAYL